MASTAAFQPSSVQPRPTSQPAVLSFSMDALTALCKHVRSTCASYVSSGKQHDGPLGPYALAEPPVVLGEGGYGTVRLGRDKRSGVAVAVKELDGAKVSDAAVVREIAALRKVAMQGHPNVAAFLGYYSQGPAHFIVTECCSGGELFKQVEAAGALAEDRARGLFAGLVAGLQHLHSAGVAHRDVKLENVLLDAAGTPKLIDLGLAHAHARSADPGGAWESAPLTHFCGSRSYCAPEVMARLPYDGFRADLWSLGVCLFAMVSGFFPVEEASKRDWRFQRLARVQIERPTASATRLIFGFYSRPCPLSRDLRALIDSLVQLHPTRRAALPDVAAARWLAGGELRADAASADAGRSPPTTTTPAQPDPADSSIRAQPDLEVSLDSLEALQRSAFGAEWGDELSTAPSGGAPPKIERQRARSLAS